MNDLKNIGRARVVYWMGIMSLAGIAAAEAGPLDVRNPVLPGADPHAVVWEGTVWLYPTHHQGPLTQFYTYSSTNFIDWKKHGPILDFSDVNWIGDDGSDRHYAWAPAIAERAGKFYFYFSVGPQGKTPSRIGVAVSDRPEGPFHDSGRPLLTGGNGFEAIDPMVFTDPSSGRSFFYAGGSAGATLRVFELNADMVSFAREIEVETPENFTEGPFVHVREGTYYLSYSHGGWRDASYSAHYATSESPVGPWRYRGKFLASDERHKGPGHHSIIQHPSTREWLVIYHRWNHELGEGPYSGKRQIAIDSLKHDADGLIRPVTMSD